MKIALFNVKYSQNLGDGLLTECLERELAGTAQLDVTSCDLAGRVGYDSGLRNRKAVLTVLSLCPAPVRRALVRAALTPTLERTLRPRWRRELASADAVVIGGGHLLSDQDLNFPLKLRAALSEVKAAGLPTAVFGVGVSDDWSAPGKALFNQAFRGVDLVHVAVRDERSRQAWGRQMAPATETPAELCFDPGVLAARHYPVAPRRDRGTLVALGLMDPLALRYHSASTRLTEAGYRDWLAQLVRELAGRGWKVALFTNGSQEDRQFLAKAAPQLTAAAPGQVSVAPDFAKPADLAEFISAADLLLAHRLHANIAAFAFARPHIGFAWDPKVEAFFGATGRQQYVVPAVLTSPADTAGLAAAALGEGIDAAVHQRIVARARGDVAQLRAALCDAVMGAAAGRTDRAAGE